MELWWASVASCCRSVQLPLEVLSIGELDLSLGENLSDVTEVAAVPTDTSRPRPATEGGSMPPDESVDVDSKLPLLLSAACPGAISNWKQPDSIVCKDRIRVRTFRFSGDDNRPDDLSCKELCLLPPLPDSEAAGAPAVKFLDRKTSSDRPRSPASISGKLQSMSGSVTSMSTAMGLPNKPAQICSDGRSAPGQYRDGPPYWSLHAPGKCGRRSLSWSHKGKTKCYVYGSKTDETHNSTHTHMRRQTRRDWKLEAGRG